MFGRVHLPNTMSNKTLCRSVWTVCYRWLSTQSMMKFFEATLPGGTEMSVFLFSGFLGGRLDPCADTLPALIIYPIIGLINV